jgi:hypothetical protein
MPPLVLKSNSYHQGQFKTSHRHIKSGEDTNIWGSLVCPWIKGIIYNIYIASIPLRLRTIYLMILVVVLGGTFGLEQPRNSHLEFYPLFVEFLSMLYKMDHKSAVFYPYTEKCNVYCVVGKGICSLGPQL